MLSAIVRIPTRWSCTLICSQGEVSDEWSTAGILDASQCLLVTKHPGLPA